MTTEQTPAALAAEIRRLAHQHYWSGTWGVCENETRGALHAAIDRLEAMASAAQGEPVAWRWVPSKVWEDYVYTDDPERAQEARDFVCEPGGVESLYLRLVAAQPAPCPDIKERKPLTEPQITDLYRQWDDMSGAAQLSDFVRLVERSHGIGEKP